MRKFLCGFLCFSSSMAFAATPSLNNLSSSDVKNVSNEFAVNFAHTAVAAPETDGLWGVEVGVVGGTTKSPKLADLIDNVNGKGSDFKTIYHGGVMARAHFPLDLFVEASLLPQRTISDVTVKNQTLGLGWNAGGYFNLPLDLAIGASFSKSYVSFDQTGVVGNLSATTTVKMNSKTRVVWVGASKTFAFFTPYAKFGVAHSDSVVDSTAGSIFAFTTSKSESSSKNGGYAVLGANIQVFFVKLGAEVSQMIGVRSATGKLSVDF